ncbi:hypothetical protein [Fundidesulfovibrio butyratiphilus]
MGRSGERQRDYLWNSRLGFWVRFGATVARFQMTLGLEDPKVFVRPKPVCRVDVAWSQPPASASGALVRYGADVVLAVGEAQAGSPLEFKRFLAMHEYDLVQASLSRPGGKKRDMLLITSVNDANASLNVFKYVRCLYEFRAWRASGLLNSLPGESNALCEGRHPPLVDMVLAALDEQLAKRQVTAGGGRLSRPSSCSLNLTPEDGRPEMLFEVLADIAPQSLFVGAGRLVLSRQKPEGGRCLVLPAKAGPFFTQAMHRQGIAVVTYAIAKSGVVFFGLDEALAAMA